MNRRPWLSLFLLCMFVAGLGYCGYLLFQDTDDPIITLAHKAEMVSPSVPLHLTVSDVSSPIRHVTVAVRHKENETLLFDQKYSDGEKTKNIIFTLKDSGLGEGDIFDLEIATTDASYGCFGFGNKKRAVYPMRIDTTPPRISVKTFPPYVRRGGTGCIAYSVSKETNLTGVQTGDFFFPAYRQENGDFLCFFAFPYAVEVKNYAPKLFVQDVAGNTQSLSLSLNRLNRQFKTDAITISQGFLDAKAAEFEAMQPGPMSDIERFLKINGEQRRKNAETLLQLGQNSASSILWKGPFLRLPRAASRAGFADHRTYFWEGRKVDEQTHLGFDLASLKQSPIPAANDGRVIFTGFLGIYGNMVLIDHGLGLQSLYSHMSEISVNEGQLLEKGQIIGKTGATGMAGGDHLHFGILVSGLEVTPLEWLDDHWIQDNVIDRLKEAGMSVPLFEAGAGSTEATPAQPGKKQKGKKR